VGTNYYIEEPTCHVCGRAIDDDPETHIGKTSSLGERGYRFISAWNSFALKNISDDTEIWDEYGRKLTGKEFKRKLEDAAEIDYSIGHWFS
jgi:hypothetical protein